MMTFAYSTKCEFHADSPEVAARIARDGYAVVKPWDAGPEALLAIAQRFGRVQMHVRADENGVVGIAKEPAGKGDWEKYRSEYHGIGNQEFLPHTDGSYLHGLARDESGYRQLLPPRMLLLQCVQGAASGGRNVLIDGQAVRRDLACDRPSDLALLSRKGSVAYCRDDQIALDCAVFHQLDDGTIMLRFRFDSTAYVADWAAEAFATLQERYFADPRYWQCRAVEEGEILIVDNHRMLHGRERFADSPTSGKRQMRRVWLAHDGGRAMRSAVGQHVERRALERFQAYGVLPPAPACAAAALPALGIRRAA